MKRRVGLTLLLLLLSTTWAQEYGGRVLTFGIYSMNETDQVSCDDSVLGELADPEVFAVFCYYTTLTIKEVQRLVEIDVKDGRTFGWKQRWDGWQPLDDGGVWGSTVNTDGTAGKIYITPATDGRRWVTAYSLRQ